MLAGWNSGTVKENEMEICIIGIIMMAIVLAIGIGIAVLSKWM